MQPCTAAVQNLLTADVAAQAPAAFTAGQPASHQLYTALLIRWSIAVPKSYFAYKALPGAEPCFAGGGQVINLKVARLRITVLRGKRWWRMAEPCLLMAAFVTLGMLLPLAFPCTPTQCYIEQGQTQPVCPPGVSPNVQCAPAAAQRGGGPQCISAPRGGGAS